MSGARGSLGVGVGREEPKQDSGDRSDMTGVIWNMGFLILLVMGFWMLMRRMTGGGSPGGQIFNIGSGKQTTVNYIANAISKNHVYIPKRPGEPDRSQANIKKAKKLLKWKPIINIDDGIKILLKNIDYWRKAPVWNPESINEATKIWFKYLK